MDGRREPRFQIYAPAKLTFLDSPERELECLLLDISPTGLKFVAGERLHVDEIVALEVEDHLILADVRHSQARGCWSNGPKSRKARHRRGRCAPQSWIEWRSARRGRGPSQ